MRCFGLLFVTLTTTTTAFMFQQQPTASRRFTTTSRSMATVPVIPDESNKDKKSMVGVVGRGFVFVLTAKLAALAGYDTWMLYPEDQRSTITSLIGDDIPSNLELIPSINAGLINDRLGTTNAMIFSSDNDTPLEEGIINYVLDNDIVTKNGNLKRIVTMSRNLNGKDMGWLVKASKKAANNDVWDNSSPEVYQNYEEILKRKAAECGAEYTIARAGTLKGGGAGGYEEPSEDEEDDGEERSEYLKQYLSREFYAMTKTGQITWQLLFDCSIRGVKITKGDVLPGAGNMALLTANAFDEAKPGDTSRSAMAEAMVRSLTVENAANCDFGVGTETSRELPTDQQWKEIFAVL